MRVTQACVSGVSRKRRTRGREPKEVYFPSPTETCTVGAEAPLPADRRLAAFPPLPAPRRCSRQKELEGNSKGEEVEPSQDPQGVTMPVTRGTVSRGWPFRAPVQAAPGPEVLLF